MHRAGTGANSGRKKRMNQAPMRKKSIVATDLDMDLDTYKKTVIQNTVKRDLKKNIYSDQKLGDAPYMDKK
ncbi:MAG: hypothetical protein ACRDFB_06675 [Rhabdochlamydiaceae bacterium]